LKFISRLQGLQPAEAVILLADLAINLGFSMLIPYISVHVTQNLMLSATVAGTVLAVRTGVQQTLMALAGPTADLYGYKRVLIAGLLVRCIGFGSFALMSNMTGLLVSAMLSGMGGALFSSAERAAYAALRPGPDQASRFALLYTAQSVGTTLGPLVGALLLSLDFRVLSLAAGLVYLPIAALVAFFLPNLTSGRPAPTPARAVAEVAGSITTVARNRAFVLYCAISAGYWAISGQINISLPLQAAAVTGTQTAVKYLLLVSSVLVICFQYLLQAKLGDRFPPLAQWAVGSALAGASFLLLIPFPGMGGLMTCVVLSTVGGMLVRPMDYQVVMGMAPRDSLASYYGFAALAVALGGSAGQFMGGGLMDVARASGSPWLPWATFAVLGIATALGMGWLGRRPWNSRQRQETALGKANT
jgi:MFS transporter, DHA1 family, multidrug resistance protein